MFLPLLDLSNNASLIIELVFGIIIGVIISSIFFWRERKLSKNQEKIVERIEALTKEQSRLINIMEERRKSRIGWLKYISRMVLNPIKEEYEKLLDAVKNYEETYSHDDRKKIETHAKNGLFKVQNAVYIMIGRDLPLTTEYITNTRFIAKLGDEMPLVSQGFKRAQENPDDFDNIREETRLSVEGIDSIINEINEEKDD
jgi:hypothetical protein